MAAASSLSTHSRATSVGRHPAALNAGSNNRPRPNRTQPDGPASRATRIETPDLMEGHPMHIRALAAATAAAVALTTGVAACGSGDTADERAVKEAIEAYGKSLASGDGRGACAAMTARLREQTADGA